MRIDLLARRWGGPNGGLDGMAIASAFLAWTLCELGHDVRGYARPGGAPSWTHPRLEMRERTNDLPDDFADDFAAGLTITTVSGSWQRLAIAAERARACPRLVYWHHHGGPPDGHGCTFAAPPAVVPSSGWARALVLSPSSWAADVYQGANPVGSEVLVPGVGAAKGGPVAVAVARARPDLRFYALPGRSGDADRAPWHALPNAELAPGPVAPLSFLARARVVLSPTRAEVHPLTLVEAAVRGIPIVCSDLPGTHAAAGDCATYVPAQAPAWQWVLALRSALASSPSVLRLRPYREIVAEAIDALVRA